MTARPIRRNAQTPDRNGKIFYTSITSLSHISKLSGHQNWEKKNRRSSIQSLLLSVSGRFSFWVILFSVENALANRENKTAGRWTNHRAKLVQGPMIDHNTASTSRFYEKNEPKYAMRLPFFRFCFLISDLVFRRKRFGRFRKRSAMHSSAQLRSAPPSRAHLRPAPRGAVAHGVQQSRAVLREKGA